MKGTHLVPEVVLYSQADMVFWTPHSVCDLTCLCLQCVKEWFSCSHHLEIWNSSSMACCRLEYLFHVALAFSNFSVFKFRIL